MRVLAGPPFTHPFRSPQVLREFLDTCTVRDPEQGVTLQDFENYYANISASVDDDAAFDELVTSVWTPPAPSRMQRPQQAAAPFPARPQRPQASAAPRAEVRPIPPSPSCALPLSSLCTAAPTSPALLRACLPPADTRWARRTAAS